MTYPTRLLLSLEQSELNALTQIALELTRAGYRTDARHVAEDLLSQLFQRPDLLAECVRMITEREEIVLR